MPKFICGEIQRDVNHLLDAAKEMQFEETFLIIKERLLMEMEAGRLKKVPIHTVFITFYGLLTKNLITSIFLKDTTDFSVFMLEWKQYILFHLMNLLGIEKEN